MIEAPRLLRTALARAGVDTGAIEIKQLAVRFVGVGAMRCAGVPLSFLSNVLMARMLGPEGLGIFAATMAMVRILGVALAAGVPTALMRLIPSYLVHEARDKAAGCIWWAYLHAISAFAIFGGLLVYLIAGLHWFGDVAANLTGAAILGALVVLAVQRGVLQGFENIVTSQLPEFLLAPLMFAAFLAGYYVVVERGGGSATTVLAFQLAAFSIAILFGGYQIARRARAVLFAPRKKFLIKTWYSISLPMITSQLSYIVTAQSGIFILQRFGDAADVGLYNVAFVLCTLASFPWLIVNAPMPPALARLFANEQFAEVRALVTASARVAMMASLPAVAVLVFAGHWLLDLAYGAEFSGAYPLILVLMAGQIANVASGSATLILNMTGHERDVAVTGAIVAIAQVAATVALVPHYGAMGVAAVQAAAIAALNFVLVWRVFLRNGIDPTFLGAHWR